MKRLNFIYSAVPLFVLLSCGPLLVGLLGASALMLAVVSLLIIIAWGVVWMRLYTGGRLRPEFGILSVLPHSIYYLSVYTQTKVFTDPTWQNIYGLSWLAFVGVMLIALRPGRPDENHSRMAKDRTFIMMAILTIAYAWSTMASFASQLFYIQ
ncbi:MAG: hypothetical protein IJ503_10200 [Akkermansia sp.]|nr:hypothetical protein [Akkermansia sp.]